MAELITRESLSAAMVGKEFVKHFQVGGEMHDLKIKVTGNGSPTRYNKPLGELNTPADLYDFVQKSVIDMTKGLIDNPVLYKDIYREVNDPTLTRHVDVKEFTGLDIAFATVLPGESVPLASFKVGAKSTAEIVTYGTGYAITRDWIAYNEAYRVAQAQRQLGFAFNAMLNNIYLGPIIAASYTGTKTTAADNTEGASERELIRRSIWKAMVDAMKRKHPTTTQALRPTILLANSVTAFRIAEVIQNRLVEKGSEYAPLAQIQKIIAYDGASLSVAGKTYTYSGPADNKAYLIQPKEGFVELIKEDLTPLVQVGDLMKLAAEERVWEFMRGVIADTANYVHEANIPALA
jgi:hypothetical protein